MIETNLAPYRRGGFALIMTLLVVSVVVPVVLTILDVTTKQVRLSGNARDSEVAFNAANAGLECAQQIRRVLATTIEAVSPGTIPVACFGVTTTAEPNQNFDVPSTNGRTVHYRYQLSWGTAPLRRCTQIDTIVIVSDTDLTTEVDADDIRSIIPSYPPTVRTKTCAASSVCTIISSRGYNRACPDSLEATFAPGTVQREVLVEY